MTTIPSHRLVEASKRIAPHNYQTPMQYDHQIGTYLTWENRQLTGSVKVSGALNKIMSLSERKIERGLVTASAGNHGQGVALAGSLVEAQYPTGNITTDHLEVLGNEWIFPLRI